MEALADRLKYAMDLAGINQARPVKLSEIKQSTLNDVLQGRSQHMRSDNLGRVCAVLGVSADWLLMNTGPVPTKDNLKPVHIDKETILSAVAEAMAESVAEFSVLGPLARHRLVHQALAKLEDDPRLK